MSSDGAVEGKVYNQLEDQSTSIINSKMPRWNSFRMEGFHLRFSGGIKQILSLKEGLSLPDANGKYSKTIFDKQNNLHYISPKN